MFKVNNKNNRTKVNEYHKHMDILSLQLLCQIKRIVAENASNAWFQR